MQKTLVLLIMFLFLSACSTTTQFTDPIVKPHAFMSETYFDKILRKGMTKEEFNKEWRDRIMRSNTRGSAAQSEYSHKTYSYTKGGSNYEVLTFTLRNGMELMVEQTIHEVGKEYVLFKNGTITEWGKGIMPNDEISRRLKKRYPVKDGLFLNIKIGSRDIPEEFSFGNSESQYLHSYKAENYKGFDMVIIKMARTDIKDDFKVASIYGCFFSNSLSEARNKQYNLVRKLEDKFNQVILTKPNHDFQDIRFASLDKYLESNKIKKGSIFHLRSLEKALSVPTKFHREWWGVSEYFSILRWFIVEKTNTLVVQVSNDLFFEAHKVSKEKNNFSESIEL